VVSQEEIFKRVTVAALICCRTNEELQPLITPQLAQKLTALEDDFKTWSKRFWKTGARFDAVIWARKASWVTLGNMTFKEAFERTGRCLPSLALLIRT
jgi:hypothetical protein